MKKHIKKIVMGIILILIIIVLGIYYNNTYGKEYLENKEIIYSLGDVINKQKQTDEKINKYLQEDYTFINAKVIQNPYGIAPLTALIIFKTDKEESITVNINGKDVTTAEKTKEHLIPIYGLYDDYENIVKLSTQNESTEYKIKTDKFEGNKINVEKTSDSLDNSLYFLSPNFESNAIYDKDGKLVWYLDGGYAGDIEYLDNGHFYISDPYQGTNGVKINYSGFLEMDYLGKIYKQYVTDYGYHHELVQLKDDKMLVLGADDNSDFLESVIYIMDLNNGKIEEEFDMYDVLYKIDPEWTKSFGINFDFVNNSAQYDENTKDLIISVRGLNSIMKINLETKKIKWIFGDPEIYSKTFEKYLLKVTDNTRYLAGQHSAFITKDGLLGVHNNDFDMFNQSDSLKDYEDNYTSVDLYSIDEDKMTIKTTWQYDADKEEFSKVAGEFKILENNNKLIDYGWSISTDAYKNINQVSINDEKYLNGVIVELDENDNVLFKAKTKDLVYRTYKVKLYDKTTNNFIVTPYQKISNLKQTNSINTSKISSLLDSATEFDGEVEAYINRIVLDSKFKKNDNVYIYLVSPQNKTYEYKYKKAGEETKNSVRVSIEKGKYAVYVKINDKMYNTNKVIQFD